MADDDEMTELLDADFPRVDLVGKGANGIPRFLIAKQDEGSRGLVPPDLVRELIGKQAGPDPETGGMVTMTATPAAMAEMLARVRKGTQDEDVAKEKNDTADREHKAATGAAMPDGSYPIASEADLTKAIHAVGRGGSSHNAIRKHIITRARSLGKSSLIPDNWASDGSIKEGSVSKEAVSKDMGPELDDGIDQLDPTVPLCAPEDDAPGDPTDPGSPAWEAIDAATAQKWTSIAVRLKNALSVMAEREMLEAASADPCDAENAFDLEDAMCAVDYVIGTLAGFAVDEQAEADLGGEAMEAVGKGAADPAALAAIRKAMDGADLTGPLAQLEFFGAVAKSGRVLSAVNEAHLREAHARLNTVLSSLPAPTADDGQPVAKEKENAVDATETAPVAKADSDEQARSAGPVTDTQVPGMGAIPGRPENQTMPTPSGRTVLKAAVFDQRRALLGLVDPAAIVQVAKADGDGKVTMQAVFDENGNLIGICDPADITPVAGAGGKGDTDGDGAAMPAADAGDMTPAPAGETGTPADAPEDGNVAKQDGTITADMLRSIARDAARTALDAQGAAHQEVVAKMAADKEELAEELRVVKARLETVENTPAAPKVFTNGQVPPAHQLRGQDQGAPPQVDVAKAAELKRTLYTGTAQQQNAAFGELQAAAIEQVTAMHASHRPA